MTPLSVGNPTVLRRRDGNGCGPSSYGVRARGRPAGGVCMSISAVTADDTVVRPRWRGAHPSSEVASLSTPQGFREFYDAALPAVFSHLLRRCDGDRALAEDLTQETFLAAARQVRDGRADELSVAWLMTVAQNKFIDHVRRRRRDERNLVVAWENGEHDELRTWRRERDRQRARDELEDLPAMQRAALILFYLEDLTVAQTAARLGKSVRATESLLARGRDALRRQLAQEAGDA